MGEPAKGWFGRFRNTKRRLSPTLLRKPLRRMTGVWFELPVDLGKLEAPVARTRKQTHSCSELTGTLFWSKALTRCMQMKQNLLQSTQHKLSHSIPKYKGPLMPIHKQGHIIPCNPGMSCSNLFFSFSKENHCRMQLIVWLQTL